MRIPLPLYPMSGADMRLAQKREKYTGAPSVSDAATGKLAV